MATNPISFARIILEEHANNMTHGVHVVSSSHVVPRDRHRHYLLRPTSESNESEIAAQSIAHKPLELLQQ